MQNQYTLIQLIPERFAAAAPQVPCRRPLDFFIENHPKRALPQHVPATRVGTISEARVSPYVTLGFAAFARDQRLCLHPRPLGPWTPWPLFFRLLSPSIPRVADGHSGATGRWRTAGTGSAGLIIGEVPLPTHGPLSRQSKGGGCVRWVQFPRWFTGKSQDAMSRKVSPVRSF